MKQANINTLKRILAGASLMLILPALILCQNADKKGGEEQAVRQVINELLTAVQNNDTKTLDRIYADDFTFVSDTGVLSTKAQRFAAMKSSELKYSSVSLEDVNIRFYGNTAVANFRVKSKFKLNGENFEGRYAITGTFIKSKKGWQEVAVQSTKIADQ